MKNYIKYLGILTLGMISCEAEFEKPVDEPGFFTSGEANFSNYVALGNSLTAGYADNALYISGQENSFPNILAQQFAKVQDTEEFRIPYMNDNVGGLLFGGQPNPAFGPRLVLSIIDGDTLPRPYSGNPTTEVLGEPLVGPFNNMGVPGAKSFHLLAPGYGNPAGLIENPPSANPYFVRFASSPETSVVQDAVAQEPTFFTLWIGNNDVLGYATSGGVDEAEITPPATFKGAYDLIVGQLASTGADGVLINIPNVTDVPYFTTVPNNAMVLDAATAASLTGFFQAVVGIFTQYLMNQGVPQAQAQALASQYAFQFQAGPNRFLIDVPVSQTNPLGVRQMTEEELLVLKIDQNALRTQGYGSVAITPEVMQVLGKLQAGVMPTEEEAALVLDAINGIDDKDALDASEIANIEVARTAYNEAIEAAATTNNLAFLDAANLLASLSESGIPYDEGTLTSEFAKGGAFSLDGVHLTPRGNALVANKIIEEINEYYHASVPKVNVGYFPTITPSNSVQ